MKVYYTASEEMVNEAQDVLEEALLMGDDYPFGPRELAHAMVNAALSVFAQCETMRQANDRRANRHSAKTKVYYISDGESVKIGISTNPEKRLKGLQTSHAKPLTVLATENGSARKEMRLHRRFKQHRLSGEWFEMSEEIKEHIAKLKGK